MKSGGDAEKAARIARLRRHDGRRRGDLHELQAPTRDDRVLPRRRLAIAASAAPPNAASIRPRPLEGPASNARPGDDRPPRPRRPRRSSRPSSAALHRHPSPRCSMRPRSPRRSRPTSPRSRTLTRRSRRDPRRRPTAAKPRSFRFHTAHRISGPFDDPPRCVFRERVAASAVPAGSGAGSDWKPRSARRQRAGRGSPPRDPKAPRQEATRRPMPRLLRATPNRFPVLTPIRDRVRGQIGPARRT